MSEQIDYCQALKARKPPEGLMGWVTEQGGLSKEYLIYKAGWFQPDPLTGMREQCADVVCTACGGSFKTARSASEVCECHWRVYSQFGFFHPFSHELVRSREDTTCPLCGAKAKGMHVSDYGAFSRQRAWTAEIAVIEAGNATPRLAVLDWMTERITDKEGESWYSTALWTANIVEERKLVSVRGYDNYMGNCAVTSELRQHKNFHNSYGEYQLLWPWDVKLLEGTTAENSKLDLYIKAGGKRLVDWLALWRKKPQAENLLTQGCGKLMAELLEGNKGLNYPVIPEIEWKEKRPHAMLHLTKEEFRDFGRKLTKAQLRLIGWARRGGLELKNGYEDVKRLDKLGLDSCGYVVEAVGKRDFWRGVRYLEKQRRTAVELRDYRNMAKTLELGMTDPQVLWPRDLKAAHDRAVRLYNARKDVLNNKKWAERAAELQKFAWERDGILIRPCATQGELRTEGQLLEHCVYSYADDVIKGKTAIFFIRHADKPEEPWYTLELDEKTFTVRQDRGLNNCNQHECAGEDAGDFGGGDTGTHGVGALRNTGDREAVCGRQGAFGPRGVGEFGEWVRTQTGYSMSTANNFMRLYNEYGQAQGSLFGTEANSQTIGNLPYSKCLALLELPAEEREDFAREVDAESISVRELREKIREREEKLAEAENRAEGYRLKLEREKLEKEEALREREDELEGRERELEKLNRELDELRAAPRDVAVETVVDYEAVKRAADEARTVAEKSLKGKIAKAEKERDLALAEQKKAERAKADAEEKLAEAELKRDDAETAAKKAGEIAAEQLAQLQKKLAAADSPEKVSFAFWFRQGQECVNSMLDCLDKLREDGKNEDAGKLQRALRAFLDAAREKVGG